MKSILKRIMLAVIAVALLAPATLVHANRRGNPTGGKFAKNHPRRNQVNQRVRNQRGRINQGVASGKLTQQQAHQLRSNDNAIKAQEHADVRANGGSLTPAEQKQFNQEENANSKMIYDEKHPAGQ